MTRNDALRPGPCRTGREARFERREITSFDGRQIEDPRRAVAVDDAAERSAGEALFEHARRVVVGITRVHDERQSDLLCRLDTRTEPGCTGRARALVVETVEPVAGDSIF